MPHHEFNEFPDALNCKVKQRCINKFAFSRENFLIAVKTTDNKNSESLG